jgi:acetyl-CoA carboxylase biotin carboxyl carrier protein
MGTHVERDTMVAIVETMKLMNSVYAGTAGRIAEICLADGQFAAQAAVLMRIEPDAA